MPTRWISRSSTTLAVVALVCWATALSSATAVAAEGPSATPLLSITGTPTPAESTTVEAAWELVRRSFPASATCLLGVEVRVVDRAEDFFDSGGFAIAALYENLPQPIIYIEHGKVTPANIVHEMAHHLDHSCGFGTSALGAAFRIEAGFPADQSFYGGRSWRDVPAEHFAEAVLEYLGIGPLQIEVTNDAVSLIRSYAMSGWTRTPPRRFPRF